jgi:hypothetical protein
MGGAVTKAACALLAVSLAVGGCAGKRQAFSLSPPPTALAAARPCASAEVTIAFDFEGASPARCVIEGPRSFTLVIGPEHGPPINPSPWYAFRYRAANGPPVSVTLTYLGARHRYTPKLSRGGETIELDAAVGATGNSATLSLPAGKGIVSAQPLYTPGHYARFLDAMVRDYGARRITLGRSLDGRAIDGVTLGSPDAPCLIVLLGRQHPPEVTGSYAMEPFVAELARILKADPSLAARFQVLAVPLVNPDGVALGHWRANRGGVDLNRDWGTFTQPETRAVRDYLAALPVKVRPFMTIDFHSTARNLFYVQGAEATPDQARVIAQWLDSRLTAFARYPFTVERSNANPGAGTSKTWFNATYGIPAITYEVGDATSRQNAEEPARELARTLLPILATRSDCCISAMPWGSTRSTGVRKRTYGSFRSKRS